MIKRQLYPIYSLLILIASAATFRKVLIPDERALCLDGTRGAYYIEDSGRNPRKFIIHFEGGGWCGGYDMEGAIQNCYERSGTPFGSSSTYPATMTVNAGLLSDSLKNSFADYTKIYVKYCDGSGHQGSRQNPVSFKGKNIYFRGQDITIGVFNHLQQTHGFFSKSQEIMVTGSSAGGVAAFLWLNYVWEKATIKNVYGVPDAGIFLDYTNYRTGRSQLKSVFMNLFKYSNVQTNPPVPQCVNAHPGETYLCMFAENIYPHLKTIIFPIQSLYDTVSIPVIVGADCLKGRSLDGCTSEQRTHIEDYHLALANFLGKIGQNPYNGFWAPVCAQHMLTYDQKFYSPNWTVPMKTVNTIDKSLIDWVLKKAVGHKYIDSGVWPSNQPCSK